MAERLLTRRQLGRATLARQLLLQRRKMTPLRAIEALAGMQAQAPLAPYVGLWTRLTGFQAEDLAALMRSRTVVRASLMRITIHLVSARDAVAWWPVLQGMCEGGWRGSQWSKQLGSARAEDVLAAAVDELAAGPRGRTVLGQILAERFPDADAFALGGTVLYLLPTVQPTPRGVWGEGGPATITPLPTWVGAELAAKPSVDDLVLRGLAALGPATVMDIQGWSRLTRLAEVFDRLGPRLRRFRSEDGGVLYDLPRAPRPTADVPAPVRFLPEFDNLLLSHADRRRVNPDGRQVPLFPGNGAQMGTVLVDGDWAGLWRIRRAKGKPARLLIEPFARLSRPDAHALEEEGQRLLEFVAPGEPGLVDITRP